MGTSISQSSPRTPNWHAVATAFTNETIPIERTVQELWRAATNQPIGDLTKDLGAPIVAECLNIAQNATSREQALNEARRTIALSQQTSLATDIAQRAIVHSFSDVQNRISAFTKSLFSQAGDYLVSRDISGYVGTSDRTRTVSDTFSLKNSIRNEIATKVSNVPIPRDVSASPTNWKSYIQTVVNTLKGE